MANYDVSEVKSVQKFLVDIKSKFDTVNAKLEDSDKIDYDAFSDSFYKANEGILKNRDDLKKEKSSLSTKLEEYTNSMGELEKQLSSIDVELPNKYNRAIEELNGLKKTMKEGGFDVDVLKSQHQSEIQKLSDEFQKQLSEQLGVKENELNSTKTVADTFQSLYFSTLKRDGLVEDLDRIKVNPEDKPLIMQAYLGRAEIAQDGDSNYGVVYKTDKGDAISGKEFWDKWASDPQNQKYILAESNTGGGASGLKKSVSLNKRAQLAKELESAKDLKQRLSIVEQMAKLDN
jgi:hypothetical protein